MIRRKGMAFIGSVVVLVGVALFAVAQAGEEKSAAGSEGSSKQLLERLKELEARVAQLEQRAAIPSFPLPATNQPFPSLAPPYVMPPALPQGSVPREFNGLPYYIVPIDKATQAK